MFHILRCSTSQYNFVIGAQPYFQWNGITVGLDFALSIPTMDPIQYNPSITYPENPISPQLDPWEVEFNTNNQFLGTLLSAAAPFEFNLLELTGTARLSADAQAQAGIYLENGANHADIGASIGAGLNLTLNLEASSDLLNGLPKQLRDMLPTDFTFQYPIAGTPTFSTPNIEVSLGGPTFDIDAFRADLAAIDPLDEYHTADDVIGNVTILGIPLNLADTNSDGDPDEVNVTIGASASAYAETSATAGLDFFFQEVDEYGNVLQSKSIFETFGHLWTRAIEVTEATVVKSETGSVEIHPDGLLELVTGSPSGLTTIVETEEDTNLLAFEADFLSAAGAEGILQVLWDNELIATIDERTLGEDEEAFIFTLPETYGPGAYALSFRLDPLNEIVSNITIDNITAGYLDSAPALASYDFDQDGDFDADDADAITGVGNLIIGATVPPADVKFDVNTDNLVDGSDLAEWLAIVGSLNGFGGPVRRGDTDVDGDVDTDDLTNAITNYTGAGATSEVWSKGDNDGDGDVDTGDLTTAITNFTGASAANPNVPDLIYNPATGNVTIDADGADVISFSLQSGPFNAADFSELPAGLTDNIASQIGWTSFNLFSGLTGRANLGAILPVGLDLAGLEAALTTASYGLAISGGGGGGGRLDLIIPEPALLM